MDARVFEFANVLRRHAGSFGPLGGVEWRYDESPVAYPDALSTMEARVAAIGAGEASELIWFLEHPPLYTAGTRAAPADLLEPNRFPVFQAGRGGQYTYHGPGQLVAYVLLDLNRRGRDVRRFVEGLENWVIAGLKDYNVVGMRREGHPGVWIEREPAGHKAKIAAIGVRVRRWITYHGVAINICPDLSHFAGIVPCGITDAGVTSLEELGASRTTSRAAAVA